MKDKLIALTERGQVCVPASIRRPLDIEPAQTLVWQKVSEDEVPCASRPKETSPEREQCDWRWEKAARDARLADAY